MQNFKYAIFGLGYALKTQNNFRIHLIAAILALMMGCFFDISTQEWLWIILSVFLVIAAELINTAIETLTDLVSPAWHEKAGQTKDVSAGAVMVIAIFALLVGAIIFMPKLISSF